MHSQKEYQELVVVRLYLPLQMKALRVGVGAALTSCELQATAHRSFSMPECLWKL